MKQAPKGDNGGFYKGLEAEDSKEEDDDDQNKTRGRWTKEEHKMFVQGNKIFTYLYIF